MTTFVERVNKRPPRVRLPKVSCDVSLGDVPAPLPRSHHFMVICGRPGSGKSSLATALYLTSGGAYYRRFNSVYACVPPTSRQSMGEHDPWLKHDARKVFDELDSKVLETVQTRGEGNATSDECSLLWLDDCGADLKTGGPRLAKQLRKLAWNRRHLRTSVCACVQSWVSLPLDLRKTISHAIIFRPANRAEWHRCASEMLAMPRDRADALFDLVYKQPHDFLLLDAQTGALHHNWNRLEELD